MQQDRNPSYEQEAFATLRSLPGLAAQVVSALVAAKFKRFQPHAQESDTMAAAPTNPTPFPFAGAYLDSTPAAPAAPPSPVTVSVQVPIAQPVAVHESLIQKINPFHHDTPGETTVQKIELEGKKVLNLIEFAGKNAEKGLLFAATYLPEAESLVGVFFPQASAVEGGLATAKSIVTFIQNGVVWLAASYGNIANETGAQYSTDLLQLAESLLMPLLKQIDPKADTSHLEAIINAVVAAFKARFIVQSQTVTPN